jgi:hypothetical protein
MSLGSDGNTLSKHALFLVFQMNQNIAARLTLALTHSLVHWNSPTNYPAQPFSRVEPECYKHIETHSKSFWQLDKQRKDDLCFHSLHITHNYYHQPYLYVFGWKRKPWGHILTPLILNGQLLHGYAPSFSTLYQIQIISIIRLAKCI